MPDVGFSGFPDTPMTTMSDVINDLRSAGRSSTASKSPWKNKKKKKSPPPPLRIVPQHTQSMDPTPRQSVEKMKEGRKEPKSSLDGNNSDEQSYGRGIESSEIEGASRPKSPGKSIRDYIRKTFTSSETPPSISRQWSSPPPKAVKILGEESLGRAKAKKLKKQMEEEDGLDFKCAGIGDCGVAVLPRGRSITITSVASKLSSASTPNFQPPTDEDIRSLGPLKRAPARVPTLGLQDRYVSDSTTIHYAPSMPEIKCEEGYTTDISTLNNKHLHGMHEMIPPTPPSKDSRRKQMPLITSIPIHTLTSEDMNDTPSTRSTKASITGSPSTPLTAVNNMIGLERQPSPLPANLARIGGSDYVTLKTKSSKHVLSGAAARVSLEDAFIDPCPSYPNVGLVYAIPPMSFNETLLQQHSAGMLESDTMLSKSVSPGSNGSPHSTSTIGRSRRWSDGSLTAWRERDRLILPVLPTSVYTPSRYTASPATGAVGSANFRIIVSDGSRD